MTGVSIDVTLGLHRCGTQFVMMVGGGVVSPNMKQVCNRIMDGDKALQVAP